MPHPPYTGRRNLPRNLCSFSSYSSPPIITYLPVHLYPYHNVPAQAYLVRPTGNGFANIVISPVRYWADNGRYLRDKRYYGRRSDGYRAEEGQRDWSNSGDTRGVANKEEEEEEEATGDRIDARDERRHRHRHNISVDSASTIANSVPFVTGTSVEGGTYAERQNIEEDCEYMMTWPTVSERICVRWALQPDWKPHMGEMNRISEPTTTWLLTSLKHFYIDLRILHPWHVQHIGGALDQRYYPRAPENEQAAADGQEYISETERITVEGGIKAEEGNFEPYNYPLFAGNERLVFPGRPTHHIASDLNPITSGTLIEHMSAGHYRKSDEKVQVSAMADVPLTVPSHNIDVTWSEWINGEPAWNNNEEDGAHRRPNRLCAKSWQASLGTCTTKLEYEGTATFRIVGRKTNPVTQTMGVYQEGWKVVPVTSMPLSSKVSLSTSNREAIDRYRASRHRRTSSNQSNTTTSSRDVERKSAPCSNTPLRSGSRLNNIKRTRDRVLLARTSIVLCYENPSLQARGMVIRVGDRCQGILRIGDHVTVERWQWYPGAAESAASLNTAARDEAGARKNRSRSGISGRSGSKDEGRIIHRDSLTDSNVEDNNVAVGDGGDKSMKAHLSASPSNPTPALQNSQSNLTTPASAPAAIPAPMPTPTPISTMAITDRGAGWTRELRIGQGYLPCSIAFGVCATKIREGTQVSYMDMVWEVAEVFCW